MAKDEGWNNLEIGMRFGSNVSVLFVQGVYNEACEAYVEAVQYSMSRGWMAKEGANIVPPQYPHVRNFVMIYGHVRNAEGQMLVSHAKMEVEMDERAAIATAQAKYRELDALI